MNVRRLCLLLLYLVGAATMVLTLVPLIHLWAVPVGLVAFGLFLKMPYYSRWQ